MSRIVGRSMVNRRRDHRYGRPLSVMVEGVHRDVADWSLAGIRLLERLPDVEVGTPQRVEIEGSVPLAWLQTEVVEVSDRGTVLHVVEMSEGAFHALERAILHSRSRPRDGE
jgi:hypothetical protein